MRFTPSETKKLTAARPVKILIDVVLSISAVSGAKMVAKRAAKLHTPSAVAEKRVGKM